MNVATEYRLRTGPRWTLTTVAADTRGIPLYAAIFLAACFLYACAKKHSSPTPEVSGLMKISLALVPTDVTSVVATVTGGSITAPVTQALTIAGSPPTATGTVTSVPSGSDTVTVNGFPAAPENMIAIYTGSATTTVTTGSESDVTITLDPVNADVTVTATLPAGDSDISKIDHTTVEVSGARVNTGLTYYLTLDSSAGTATGTAIAIPVGAARTFDVSSYDAGGTLLFSGAVTNPVVAGGSNLVGVTLTNRTGYGPSPIQHIFIIMQENRSFDHYFGTFPGVDGIPTLPDGGLAPCLPQLDGGPCVGIFHDVNDVNAGGPHGTSDAVGDINRGAMNGFVEQQQIAGSGCVPNDPMCAGDESGVGRHDVMGYHDGRELPNYWQYAQTYLLQDHLFESVDSWSLPSHLFLVSEWSAECVLPDGGQSENPADCASNLFVANPLSNNDEYDFAWTDLTYLLHNAGVSWKNYLVQGTEPDCDKGEMTCEPLPLLVDVAGIWNVLPSFETVKQDGQTANVVDFNQFYGDVANGTVPQVAWFFPSDEISEHPPNSITMGQAYVTGIVNAIMQDPKLWATSVIFISWDDWGGFYEHVDPPHVDVNGWGFRVPGLTLSPWVRQGIDHQQLSHDAYAKFIEDMFLGGQRLDPTTDMRPDPRPDVRENNPDLGDLRSEFDFTQTPLPPLVLDQCPGGDFGDAGYGCQHSAF